MAGRRATACSLRPEVLAFRASYASLVRDPAALELAQIARKLFLSPSTGKRHAHNIYGKLGVGSRTQAVARSKTLGILPPG